MYVKAPGGEFVHCPRCQSTDLRYSDATALIDLVMWLYRKHALRCRACRNRFHARTDEAANWVWTSKG
jgi:hypothetical protein